MRTKEFEGNHARLSGDATEPRASGLVRASHSTRIWLGWGRVTSAQVKPATSQARGRTLQVSTTSPLSYREAIPIADQRSVGGTEPRRVNLMTFGIEDGGNGRQFVDVGPTMEFSKHTAPPKG